MSGELDEVILEREFEVDGSEAGAVLRIGKPAEHPGETGTARSRSRACATTPFTEACGVDSLQALSMCLRMARAQLESSRRSARITWLGGADLGL
jgi:hypothetical protein